MPESRTRKAADAKRKVADKRKAAEREDTNEALRDASAPTAAERRREERRAERAEAKSAERAEAKSAERAEAKSAERAEARSAERAEAKSAGTKSSTANSSGAKASASKPDRRTTAERRGVASRRRDSETRVRTPSSRRWVPPTFIAAFLLGVAWLIVFYVAGDQVPFMMDWGNWNILVGMGLMAFSFIVATLWK